MPLSPATLQESESDTATGGQTLERPIPFVVRGLRWFEQRSPIGVWAVATFLIACIGIFSWVSGPELSGSLLYLIPILLVSHVSGFRSGILAASLAAMIWLTADLSSKTAPERTFTPYWNALMRFGTFFVAVCLVAAMRSMNAHLEKRVQERTAALEAQIIENRELEKSILEISDREQVRIGQDLHDGLCQQLVSAAFTANMLGEQLEAAAIPANRDARRIGDMLDEAINQARNLARGLYPVRLETEGLELALRELAATMSRRFQIACSVKCASLMPNSDPSVGIHFYRIAQEAVTNAARHARARNVVLSLSTVHSRVKLSIEDDGEGMVRASQNADGMGLRIMAYRARMIGADFKIAHRLPHGTIVSCEMEAKVLIA